MKLINWLLRKPTHKAKVPDLNWSGPCDCSIGEDHHWNDMFPVDHD